MKRRPLKSGNPPEVLLLSELTASNFAELYLRTSNNLPGFTMEGSFPLNEIALSSPDHIFIQDIDLRYILIINPQLGHSHEDAIGKTDVDLLPAGEASRLMAIKRQVLETGQPVSFSDAVCNEAGHTEVFDGKYIPLKNEKGEVTGLLGFFRNVSEIKKKEEELRNTLESIQDGFFALDKDWNFVYVNDAAEKLVGNKREELLGKNHWKVYPEALGTQIEEEYRLAATGETREWDNYYEPWDRWFHIRIFPREGGGVSSFFQDITAKKQAEVRILKLNRTYSIISQINKAIVRLRDKHALMKEACRIAVESGQFIFAWIGFAQRENESVIPMAYFGKEDHYLEAVRNITYKNKPEGQSPVGSAIREGKVFICDDIETDPAMALWKKEALRRGYRSSIALPLRLYGSVIGSLNLYSHEKGIFEDEEVELLEEVASDISFALEAMETGRKQEETLQALIKSESLLRQAQRIAKIGNWLNDLEGNLIISDELYKIFGIRKDTEKYSTESFMNLIHPDDRHLMREWTTLCLEGHEPGELIFRIVRPDGKIRYISGRGALFADQDGKSYLAGTAHDITEGYISDLALRESELRIRMLLESSMDGIMLTAPDGRILSANPAMCAMLGMTEQEICRLGRNGIVDVSDPRISQIIAERSLKGKAKGEIFMIHKNGSRIHVEVSSSLFTDRNGEVKSSMIVRDITERKRTEEKLRKSEEKYRLLAENSADVIWTLDPEGSFTYVSPSVTKLRGYTPEEVISQPISEALTPDSLQVVTQAIVQVTELIRQGVTYIEPAVFELEQPCKDGSTVWTEALVKPMFDDEMRFLGYLGITRDISDRKKARQIAEQRANEQLLMARITEKLVSINTREEMDSFIGQQIYNLTENAYVILSDYNSERKTMRLTNLLGFGDQLTEVIKKFGVDPYRFEIKVTDIKPDDLIQFKNQKLNNNGDKGLYFLSAGKLNKKISRALEVMLGIRTVYSMGFSWNDKLYGGVGILSKDVHLLANHTLIETIIKQGALAFQRLYTMDELVRSEKKYRSLVELSPDGIALTDLDGRFISCNQELANIFGYKDESDLKASFNGNNKLLKLQDKERAPQEPRGKFRSSSLPMKIYSMKRKDGTTFPAEVKRTLIQDSDGYSGRLLLIVRDITERKMAEEKLKNYNEQLRNYSAYSDRVREQERINLARDIHDIFGSSLAGLKMELAILKQLLSGQGSFLSPEINLQLKSMSSQIDESVDLMREIVKELRPGILDKLGLIETIRWYAGEIEKRSGIAIRYEISLKDLDIDPKLSVVAFRIFQEIMNNIVRHSEASVVWVTISTNRNRSVRMKIRDNGRGITQKEMTKVDSFGIIGMKERASLLNGQLTITGEKGKGTTVVLEFPVQRKD